MVRRTVAVLALLLPLASASASSAGQAPPLPTVDTELVCPANDFVVTIDNQTALSYEVVVTMGPDAAGQPPTQTENVTVGPDSQVEVVLDITDSPFIVSVTGDGDFPRTAFTTQFGCPFEEHFTYTTVESTAVEIELPCSPIGELQHGTLAFIDLFRATWTPDPGFVGQETLDFSCSTSMGLFGTLTFVVTPAQLPAEPVPEEPTFTG